MMQVAILNDYAWLIFARPWNFEIFHDQLGLGRWLILGHVRKSHYGLKYGGIMQCIMKRITFWNGHAQLAFSDFGRPRVLSFSERLVQNQCIVNVAWVKAKDVAFGKHRESKFFFVDNR